MLVGGDDANVTDVEVAAGVCTYSGVDGICVYGRLVAPRLCAVIATAAVAAAATSR